MVPSGYFGRARVNITGKYRHLGGTRKAHSLPPLVCGLGKRCSGLGFRGRYSRGYARAFLRGTESVLVGCLGHSRGTLGAIYSRHQGAQSGYSETQRVLRGTEVLALALLLFGFVYGVSVLVHLCTSARMCARSCVQRGCASHADAQTHMRKQTRTHAGQRGRMLTCRRPRTQAGTDAQHTRAV